MPAKDAWIAGFAFNGNNGVKGGVGVASTETTRLDGDTPFLTERMMVVDATWDE